MSVHLVVDCSLIGHSQRMGEIRDKWIIKVYNGDVLTYYKTNCILRKKKTTKSSKLTLQGKLQGTPSLPQQGLRINTAFQHPPLCVRARLPTKKT